VGPRQLSFAPLFAQISSYATAYYIGLIRYLPRTWQTLFVLCQQIRRKRDKELMSTSF